MGYSSHMLLEVRRSRYRLGRFIVGVALSVWAEAPIGLWVLPQHWGAGSKMVRS